MHKLSDDLAINCALLRRFRIESELDGGDARHCAFVQKSNGDFLQHAQGPEIDPLRLQFMHDMLSALNRNIAHGGAWSIVFTHYRVPADPIAVGEYERFVFLWMDGDGDVCFPVENNEPVAKVLKLGMDGWVNQCEAAWHAWKRALNVLAPRADQLYKAAQGQTAPSATVH